MNNPPNPLHEDQSATASDCTESTSSQPPPKCLRLLAKDMMCTLNRLLILLTARTTQKTLDLSSVSRMQTTVGYTLAQDLLSATASEAYVERVFSVCGQLIAGKRNQLIKSLRLESQGI